MSRVLALTGGVGGAKLGLGLAQRLSPDQLAFVVNTGDDFDHLGLRICPDLDTLMYTLSGESNTEQGWGRRNESFACLDALAALGGEAWFRLGDRDLAVHLQRTQALRNGASLTAATKLLNDALGVRHSVLPMSDDPIATIVETTDGPLSFQHYFVRDRCGPAVTGFHFDGAAHARVNVALEEWLDRNPIDGIIICPSNPFVSVDPILQVPGMTDLLRRTTAPIIAVSPIVAGLAIKGPAAKMMDELNVPRTAAAVAEHYGDLLDGFVLDDGDAALRVVIEARGVVCHVTNTIMVTLADRIALADHCLALINRLQANESTPG